MKKVIFCVFFASIMFSGFAQDSKRFDQVNLATAELTAQYNLTDAQQTKVRKAVEVQMENMEQIAALKDSNPNAYLAKKRSLREYLEGKLALILSDRQLSLLEKQQEDRRLAERALRKKMKGASQAEIEVALLKLEK
ncbi:MAG: hypothetical protein HRU41_09300 [Saprospiraceae bacterium]|nr:hypothetical protein [Saprospiraceae bacterium]